MSDLITMTRKEFEDALKEAGHTEAIGIAGNILESIATGLTSDGILSGFVTWARDTIPETDCQFCGENKAVHIRFAPSEDYGMHYDLCSYCKNKHEKSWERLKKKTDIRKPCNSYGHEYQLLYNSDLSEFYQCVNCGGDKDIIEKNQEDLKKTIVKKCTIEESHKYPGAYNVYSEHGEMIKYFCENDDKNKQRAIDWVNNSFKLKLEKQS